ncbi:uncharacterized protein N7503_010145 [Penicillium pulvis]|uniref:uncharacterized protein n=1 Tax=Penicillium pulvis TaxID=1562058 RepID=UPI002547572C|nr:uncharacterized protein N7503_010145 [Penicillium pulvis]KAJ5784933.1 hypothetical protein N7503_010145 [Penicillium pulvis]
MLSVSDIPALLGLILGLFSLHFLYQRITNPLAHVPGPEISKWTDLVYKYYWFSGKIPYYVHSLHEKYGPIVRTSTTQVDICDIEVAREIHKTNSRYMKSNFYNVLVAKNFQNLFSTTDPKFHSNRRRLLATPISDSSLSKHEPLISKRVNLAIEKIAQEMDSRGVADVFKWWLFMATDVIGELTFGESFQMLESGEKNQYSKDLESLSSLQPIRTTFPNMVDLARRLPLPIFNRAGAVANRMSQYALQSLERYTTHLESGPSTAKQTLFTKIFDEKNGLSLREILYEAQGYIVAGSDTTAVTLTYLVYSVCSDARVREKLAIEIASLPEPISDKDLRNLPYLNQVISETLRLYTAVPFGLPRSVPVGGVTLKGMYIAGGTTVSTQSYSLHRDPGIFADPDRFYPERWEDPSKDMKDASIPFGGGSRICIGIHLARIELRLATALFFRRFPRAKVSSSEGMSSDDMVMKAFFLMAPQGHRCLVEA